jgi:hypothetical protein
LSIENICDYGFKLETLVIVLQNCFQANWSFPLCKISLSWFVFKACYPLGQMFNYSKLQTYTDLRSKLIFTKYLAD